MRFGIHTLDDFDPRGKRVACRVDVNQPVDRASGKLKSTHRIEACAPTVRELSDRGARVALLAHQGSDIEYENFYSTRPHAEVLSELLGREVRFVEDVCGPLAREAILDMNDGDVIMLDNVRFCSEEQTLFERALKLSHEAQARTEVVRKLAPLFDVFVCDAFAAAHRDQPTLCGFEQLLYSAMGRLFEREYCVVSELMSAPKRPCLYVLGGAKVADAFTMLDTALASGSADKVLAGGLAGNILLAAAGVDIGRASAEFIERAGYAEYIEKAARAIERFPGRILLPLDLAYVEAGERRESDAASFPADALALDIGARTIAAYVSEIAGARTVFVNGPMGVFERPETEAGTREVWRALANASAFTVVGGGDSVAAANKFGVISSLSYVCTGGGALIRFLTGEELPVVKALRFAASHIV